jgi:hypothetical protein
VAVRGGSSWSAAVANAQAVSLTREDERRQMAVDERSALPKVGRGIESRRPLQKKGPLTSHNAQVPGPGASLVAMRYHRPEMTRSIRLLT